MNIDEARWIKETGRSPATAIDAAGWGVFFIWVGVALVAGVGWGVGLLGTGIISLGVQLARSLSALKVDRWSLAFGACLVAAGLVQWLDIPLARAPLPAWIVPGLFIVLGAGILASIWIRRPKG